MKSVGRIVRTMSVFMVAIITALAVAVLCAPEEDRIELAELVGNLNGQEDPERQIDWDSLPPEVIAWVEVPGTNIDEPIVQAMPDAPNAYLYKDVFNQGGYGTPYIDYECSIYSYFVMVYGHHMSDGSAFADFANYSDIVFAKEHKTILLYTRDHGTLELEVVAADVINASREKLVIDGLPHSERVAGATVQLAHDMDDDSRLFAFTTCSYQTWNSRTLVYAISTKDNLQNR